MICQEVIELMQRYLDRDLDESEYSRMLQHLQQCPYCTELFERLVNVSSELEKLPKVTPPISLVDAILPKLELLDAAVDQLEQERTSEAVAAAPMDEVLPPRSEANRRHSQEGWRKRTKDWFSWPVFGGVVAAGLVAGFFLFGQQQSPSNADAGKLMMSLDAVEKKAASPESGAADSPQSPAPNRQESAAGSLPAAKQDSSTANETRAVQPQAGGAGAAARTDSGAAAKTIAPSASPAPTAAAKTAPSSGGVAKPQIAPQAPAAVDSKSNAGSQPAQTPAPSVDTPKPSSLVEPQQPAPTSDSPSAVSGAPAPTQGADASARVQGPPAADMVTKGAPAAQTSPNVASKRPMGIAAMPEPTPVLELTTTDGAYKAVIQDNKVSVLDKQGKVIYASKYDWKDGDLQIELVAWSTDYKITYRVKNDNQVRTFVINVKEQTEIESKP
ncbi:zf-HC2 domain-containing protein [Paenibacillus cremeus]|uniref:Anti-sigma-W factor RsiW n=1 Tax=Paenibacillus cremeus TaxID=2163881 RepID=A0A559KAF2_9BACL|nr:zf-HC2 domain-containing protein [Paenibacillus cremeus]TVY09105.1 hypothetical protein FPZ49_15460 [Paenibacillus cremeus]